MKRWGLRALSLSADTNADAGQSTSNNHLNPNVIYMTLAAGVFYFVVLLFIFSKPYFINTSQLVFCYPRL